MSIKAYKGFNKDMTCRGFQYEEGKTYHEDEAKLCENGFHACEDPLDCFNYYDPAHSVYHEVELDDVTDERNSYDSKICGKTMKVGAALDIVEIVKAKFEYTKSKCVEAIEKGNAEQATSGDRGCSTSGDMGCSTSGYRGCSTSGYRGCSTSGDMGCSTSGYSGCSTSGDMGCSTSGDRGCSTSRGKSIVGKNGTAVARGNNCQVKGGIGSILVIIEEEIGNYNIHEWKATIVDGKTIKPDTWYELKNGKFVEVKEETE